MSQADQPLLNVVAREPFHVYYEGTAEAVTGANVVGPFDVLPGHADLFSVLVPGEIIIETGTDQVSFMIRNGIIAVRGDSVDLFVNM